MPSTTARPSTSPALISMFFGFSLGFAQVPAASIPDGVMPKHKRAASTGVSTTSSPAGGNNNVSSSPTTTSPSPTTTTPTTTTTPSTTTSPTTTTTPTTSNPPTTTTPTTTATTTPTTTSQQQTTTPTTTSPSKTTTSSKTTSPTVQSTSTTSSEQESTSSPSTTKHSSSSTTTHSSSKTSITPSSDIVRLSSTTINRATLSHKSTITHALVTSHTSQRTYTSVFVVHGTTHSSVVTEDHVVASTTGFATSTLVPTLADGGGSGGNLSTHDKQIIGGVVGGVGSAVVLIGLALVAFRLWGRKKRSAGDSRGDYFDSLNDSIHNEKHTSNQQDSDGLERYRIGGASSPNTASNF